MWNGFKNNQTDEDIDYHQRVADQNIQNIDDEKTDIQQAKSGFVGMLIGVLLGGFMGWIFLGSSNSIEKEKTIPVIRRPLVPAKVQPNEPGGMEIDNQDREIYHIVDNLPSEEKEINIMPLPETPKLVVEKNIEPIEDIAELVESIDNNSNIGAIEAEKDNTVSENIVKLANTELSGIQTNSRDKIIIPEKIKDIEVKLQNTINKEASKAKEIAQNAEEKSDIKVVTKSMSPKGSWYAQIIASSSRKSVQDLWNNLSSKHKFLKTYPYEIEEITSASGSTLYRLKVGAFKTRAEAVQLSDKLKQNKISSIIKQN